MFFLRHKLLIISLFLPFMIGCATPMSIAGPNTPNRSTLPEQAQGIKGTVLSVTGNQMPTFGDNTSRSQPQLVKTTIWIFSGRIDGKGTRWSVSQARKHPNLVGWVTSDAEGKFAVGLSPGEYTLFAQYGEDLYLNSFIGDGSYEFIKVMPGQVTETDLVNTEDAVF